MMFRKSMYANEEESRRDSGRHRGFAANPPRADGAVRQRPDDRRGGQLDALFDSLPGAAPFVKSGQVRVLAASTARRDVTLPDVPTLAESGLAGFNVLGWLRVVAPAGLNSTIRNKTNVDLKKALATDAVK